MKTIKILIIPVLLAITLSTFSQTNYQYRNKVYKRGIKTVQFYRAGWEFTYPVLELNSGKQLVLEFDDLNKNITDYYYTIVHCSSDWQPSDLNPIEYIQGFEENQIDDYENSFGTLVPYTHYTLNIPNDNLKPLISGNYLLLVYEDYDKTKPVLSQRFFVVKPQVETEAEVKRSTYVTDMNTSQELHVYVTDENAYVTDPQDSFTMTVMQNNDQNISLSGLKPNFIKGNVYEFYDPRKLKFLGGNEFRYVNFKNTKYVNDRIEAIHFVRPYYIFDLVKEECEHSLTYSYAQDINGDFLVTVENIDDPALEADYILADFSLFQKTPFTEGDVYVYGALSNDACDENNKMTYDFGTKTYKVRMKLKQGFYNYEYVFCDTEDQTPDLSKTEGNYYQTENNYSIFLYNRPQGGQYDELIGYKIVNSLKVY